MSHFASLPEHCQCYPREDVFPIFSLGSVREIHSLGKYFSVHSLGHSEYQEIHTSSALNIDSVKINTSLLMMREWVVHPRQPRDFPRPERCPEGEARGKSRGSRGAKPTAEENLEGGGDGFPNTSRVLVEHGHSLIITREGLLQMSPSGGSF